MKNFSHICVPVLALLLIALSTGCNKEAPAFDVNDVVSDPGAFTGPISVIGVIYGYSKSDPTIVGIMDRKELQCSSPNCKKTLLPVKIEGSIPGIGDELRVSGTLTREPGGYLFQAREVIVLANHALGGQR